MIRNTNALLDIEQEQGFPIDLDEVEAAVLGAAVLATSGGGRLVVNRRDGTSIGAWRLSSDRVEALALTDSEQAVAVLADGTLRVIHAATGIDLLADDAQELRGRRHAAIGIDRQLALLWSPDSKRIDLHMMSRDEAVVLAGA